MYVGVRAGGGIGDEIEDPAGDPYEMYRIVFDITFFFFVIVILLAIIQGMLAGYVVCVGLSQSDSLCLSASDLIVLCKEVYAFAYLLIQQTSLERLPYIKANIHPGTDTGNLSILTEDSPSPSPSLPTLN